MDDDVGFMQLALRLDGQVFGIVRAGTDKGHAADGLRVLVNEQAFDACEIVAGFARQKSIARFAEEETVPESAALAAGRNGIGNAGAEAGRGACQFTQP